MSVATASPTVLLQSAPLVRPAWVDGCLESVRSWAEKREFDYRFVGDELFDELPQRFLTKLKGRTPIIADLARLRLMQRYLETSGGHVLWIDADSLIVNPDWSPNLHAVAGFGEECWVYQNEEGAWRRFITPHNAFMTFAAGSPVLPFLSYLSESIIDRVVSDRIAPQMVGPKLIKALNNLADFDLYPEAGAMSPALLHEITGHPGPAVACYQGVDRQPLDCVNLCASLLQSEADISAVERLVENPGLIERLN